MDTDKYFKPELQERVFNWVSETANAIGEWTAREVPLFVQEYLQWKFWESAVGALQFVAGVIFFLILALSTYFFAYRPLRKHIKEVGWKNVSDLAQVAAITLPILFGAVGTASFFKNFPTKNVLTCVQIKVAPKVYLVETTAEFLKRRGDDSAKKRINELESEVAELKKNQK